MRIQSVAVEIDPSNPLHEICGVIDVVIAHNRDHEEAILQRLQAAIGRRLSQMKGDDSHEPVRQPDAKQSDQG